MTRRALSKPQHNLFAAGPAAATLPPAARPRAAEPFVHLCDCGRWGAHGVGVFVGVAGRWVCSFHKPVESTAA